MNFDFIKHSECSEKILNDICILKKQYWDYPLDSQREWLQENIADSDVHLFIRNNQGCLIAYLSLVEVKISHDDNVDNVDNVDMLGVGSVCVDKKHTGQHLGFLLMNLVNFYVKKNKRQGVLLCSDNLADFYTKCGWFLFKGHVFCQGIAFEKYTFFTEMKMWNKVEISKLF